MRQFILRNLSRLSPSSRLDFFAKVTLSLYDSCLNLISAKLLQRDGRSESIRRALSINISARSILPCSIFLSISWSSGERGSVDDSSITGSLQVGAVTVCVDVDVDIDVVIVDAGDSDVVVRSSTGITTCEVLHPCRSNSRIRGVTTTTLFFKY